ncbi:hypothetical protein Scep_011058 [Stephania cephalantha]|uniref:C3H1-type domain-containing protein n=1 Tax=Stephania cephalantha TaxID=152367 RepID=A0AAP0JYQ5_9MAGN
MAYDAGIQMQRGGAAVAAEGSSLSPPLDEDAMWPMNFSSNEIMESGPYPERPGEPDCNYYIRTGQCRYGMTCRFNHPPNRKLAIAAARIKGEYPERIGQPECQNEKECAYYLRTGQCKFGTTCKFHHPQPSSTMISMRGSPVYPPVQSPTTPGQQTYPGGVPNWALSRASFIPSPRWQGHSSYAQLILPQGVMPVPGWNAYTGQLASVSSSEGQPQTVGSSQFYATSRQNESSAGSPGAFTLNRSGSVPGGLYSLQRENVFPERPGQPECQFYMKTGDCKFGAVCRFHHPRERLIPAPNCLLSPLGLPLRPGEPLCIFYSRYGVCKFGPNCKFDHPMETFAYGLSASSTVNVPVVRRLLGSTSGTSALPLSSETTEAGSTKSRRLSLSETRQMSSGDENIDMEGSRTTSSIGPVASFS